MYSNLPTAKYVHGTKWTNFYFSTALSFFDFLKLQLTLDGCRLSLPSFSIQWETHYVLSLTARASDLYVYCAFDATLIFTQTIFLIFCTHFAVHTDRDWFPVLNKLYGISENWVAYVNHIVFFLLHFFFSKSIRIRIRTYVLVHRLLLNRVIFSSSPGAWLVNKNDCIWPTMLLKSGFYWQSNMMAIQSITSIRIRSQLTPINSLHAAIFTLVCTLLLKVP